MTGNGSRRPSAYLLLSAVAVLVATAVAVRQPWIGDFGLHAAVVGRLQEDLFDPADPMVRGEADSPYFTPYPLLLALIARATDVSAATVLSAAAPVNLALLLYGLRRFVGLFTDSRWAPVLTLAFVPLLWGTAALQWSGFPTLRSLVLILPYPSTVGFALMLLTWVALSRAVTTGGWWRWLLTGLLGGVLMLVHPFTALCAGLGALAIAAGQLRRLGRNELLGMLLGLAVTAAVLLGWPYFRITDVLAAAGDLDAIHRALYANPLANYGFAFAIGLPALLLRFRRDRRDPLVLLFVLAGIAVLAGGVAGRYSLGRVWPVLMLSLQVAAAVELPRLFRRPSSELDTEPDTESGRRPAPGRLRALAGLWAAGAALACLIGLAVQYGNLLLLLPREQLTPERRAAHQVAYQTDYSWVADRVGRGDVVLTGDVGVSRVLLRYEIRGVAPAWPDPWLPDEVRRRADQAELLDPATSESRRRELLAGYGVNWVLDLRGTYGWADPYAVEVVDRPGPARLLRVS